MFKEYRICMPMTVEEYNIGQLYMIARHSSEQSDENGEGVETITNEPCEDEKHGKGQHAVKRIHLTSKLPGWIRAYMPRFIYVTEESWNYYPYTVTEYTCSIIPKFSVKIWTRYKNDNGSNENVHSAVSPGEPVVVDMVDIATDPVRPHQYKENEDPTKHKSHTTGRGPLAKGWRQTCLPIMCSYKLVQVSFPVFGLQTKVEEFVHKEIRNINVLAHRQAVAWLDEWHGWTIADVRAYEEKMQQATNEKIRLAQVKQNSSTVDKEEVELDEEGNVKLSAASTPILRSPSSSDKDSASNASSSGGTTPSKQGGYISSFFKWS